MLHTLALLVAVEVFMNKSVMGLSAMLARECRQIQRSVDINVIGYA